MSANLDNIRHLALVAKDDEMEHSAKRKPPEPPDMEARVSRIEAWAEHTDRALTEIKQDIRDMRKDMREDFRVLFGAITFVALGLAGLMSKGFGWL